MTDPKGIESRRGDRVTTARGIPDETLAHVVYALLAASFFVGVTGLIAVVMAYVRRGRVRGTWLESHFTWQIRTFWYSLLWSVFGAVTLVVLVGYAVLFGVFVWGVYRVIKGWLNLADGRPMYEAPA